MSNRFNYWDIVHMIFAEDMAAKDGYGIVFNNSEEGKPYCKWTVPPIFGYIHWRDGGQEFFAIHSEAELMEDFIIKMSRIKSPSNEILEGIRRSVYLIHKAELIDNLSLIETLDKLNEYR